MKGLLLKGGVVLIHHDTTNQVQPVAADILVENDIISKIGPNLIAPDGLEVVDCSGKLISPGFIDTHNHHWESALKGTCENLTGVTYFATMFTASSVFSAEDVYWSTLAGCLQSLDAGTTTTLDYAHMSWSETHGAQALAGTVSSGIRSVFAYAPSVRVSGTAEGLQVKEFVPPWFLASLRSMSNMVRTSPRVRLGLGFDFYFLGEQVVQGIFATARSLKLQLVTSHWANVSNDAAPGLPEVMRDMKLSDDRVVISHFGGASATDCDIVNRTEKWFVSSSPSVEMTLGLGPPVCFQEQPRLEDSSCSLGADCHCASSASMISEMRTALLHARGNVARLANQKGLIPSRVSRTAQDAFLMATIRGARAMGMGDQIGSIVVGKKADLIVFDAQSPSMSPAATLDPVTAIVMHASEPEMVIVDGVVRKRDGKLLPTQLSLLDEGSGAINSSNRSVSWADVVARIVDIQQRFVANLGTVDLGKIRGFVSNLYGMKEG